MTDTQHDNSAPDSLHDRALDNITFIRDTMERSAPAASLPGSGMIAMGVIALAGSGVASLRRSEDWWLSSWVVVACLGFMAGALFVRLNLRGEDKERLSGAVRRFMFGLFPPVAAGAVLTHVFYEGYLDSLFPGMWLLLYGAGVVSAGIYSIWPIPIMGLSFLLMGTGYFLLPVEWNDVVDGSMQWVDMYLGIGFGCLHMVGGALIRFKYGT